MIPTHPTRRLLSFAVALVAAFAAGRAAAESPDPVRHYKDTFPKIAGLNIGSPQNYADLCVANSCSRGVELGQSTKNRG
jgi:hypothetical protein